MVHLVRLIVDVVLLASFKWIYCLFFWLLPSVLSAVILSEAETLFSAFTFL